MLSLFVVTLKIDDNPLLTKEGHMERVGLL